MTNIFLRRPAFYAVLLALPFLFFGAWAQESGPKDAVRLQVATEWPGITFQVIEVQRIGDGRLLFNIQVAADTKLPPGGVFLGKILRAPPGTKPIEMYRYRPLPYTFNGATMTDEQKGIQYARLASLTPLNQGFYSDSTVTTFQAGDTEMLSVQFKSPPAPPAPPPGQKPVVQMVSLLLPRAAGPIVHIPLPPTASTGESP